MISRRLPVLKDVIGHLDQSTDTALTLMLLALAGILAILALVAPAPFKIIAISWVVFP